MCDAVIELKIWVLLIYGIIILVDSGRLVLREWYQSRVYMMKIYFNGRQYSGKNNIYYSFF